MGMKAPAMKAAKAAGTMKAAGAFMSKSGLADALASATELKKSDCAKVLGSLAEIGTKELKKAGKFTLPGFVMVRTRSKPATKAGKREVFGKVVMVKAKPATTVVKAFCTSALKKAI